MSKTITSLGEKLESLGGAMSALEDAINDLKYCADDDDFRIWADVLNDMREDMEKRNEQLERDEYAEHQEEIYELTREYYRGLL